MNTISIFHKTWAFTSSQSDTPLIRTGCIGPWFVVTFTADKSANEKFAAMTCIDDKTQVESIKVIFDKFSEHSIPLKDVKVVILGGWRTHAGSVKWSSKIVTQIKNAGIINVDTTRIFSKNESEYPTNSHHFGALVDARDGKTYVSKELIRELEREQWDQFEIYDRVYGIDAVDIPIFEIKPIIDVAAAREKTYEIRQRKFKTGCDDYDDFNTIPIPKQIHIPSSYITLQRDETSPNPTRCLLQ